MKGALAVLAALVLLLGFPLAAAVLVASVATPAMAQVHRTLFCEGTLPVTGDWRPPFQQSYTMTSGFDPSRFHPVYRQVLPHTGVDLVSRPSPSPVLAAAAGQVFAVQYDARAGNVVGIDHGGGISTHYAHLAGTPDVGVGEDVVAGQQVGLEGSTGASIGAHLHFEVRVEGSRWTRCRSWRSVARR